MSELAEGFKRFMKGVNEIHKDITIAAADYAYNRLQTLSPIDTGAYRANMNRSVGEPDFSFDENKTSGSVPSVVSEKDYDVYYISNGAPYAAVLENGHSDQSPNGVFTVAINDVKTKFA